MARFWKNTVKKAKIQKQGPEKNQNIFYTIFLEVSQP